MHKVLYVLGTRPEIIRSALLLSDLKKENDIDLKIVATGQHYDENMFHGFIEELDAPSPDIYLGCQHTTHATQTGYMMIGLEDVIKNYKPNVVVVFGDTNSTLAAALAAVKLHVPVVHLEAGAREGELIPEEINRILVDHCASVNIAVCEHDFKNLEKENTIGFNTYSEDPLWEIFHLVVCNLILKPRKHKKPYALLTMHRDINVDNLKTFEGIIEAIDSIGIPVLWPIHPRAFAQWKKFPWGMFRNGYWKNITLLNPANYYDMVDLILGARVVITDSGGLQKEAFWADKFCVVLREHSGWQDLIDMGVIVCVGTNREMIRDQVSYGWHNSEELAKLIHSKEDPYFKEYGYWQMKNLIKECG